jgi:hypothetical protein
MVGPVIKSYIPKELSDWVYGELQRIQKEKSDFNNYIVPRI